MLIAANAAAARPARRDRYVLSLRASASDEAILRFGEIALSLTLRAMTVLPDADIFRPFQGCPRSRSNAANRIIAGL